MMSTTMAEEEEKKSLYLHATTWVHQDEHVCTMYTQESGGCHMRCVKEKRKRPYYNILQPHMHRGGCHGIMHAHTLDSGLNLAGHFPCMQHNRV